MNHHQVTNANSRNLDDNAQKAKMSTSITDTDIQTNRFVGVIGEKEETGTWLETALKELLEECSNEAEEEGIEMPSESTIEKARIVLKRLAEFEKEQPLIYPMKGFRGSDISIDLQRPDEEDGLSLVVEHQGTGSLFISRIRGKSAHQRIDRAENLPDLIRDSSAFNVN